MVIYVEINKTSFVIEIIKTLVCTFFRGFCFNICYSPSSFEF